MPTITDTTISFSQQTCCILCSWRSVYANNSGNASFGGYINDIRNIGADVMVNIRLYTFPSIPTQDTGNQRINALGQFYQLRTYSSITKIEDTAFVCVNSIGKRGQIRIQVRNLYCRGSPCVCLDNVPRLNIMALGFCARPGKRPATLDVIMLGNRVFLTRDDVRSKRTIRSNKAINESLCRSGAIH